MLLDAGSNLTSVLSPFPALSERKSLPLSEDNNGTSFNIQAGSAMQASEADWDLSDTHSCVLCFNTANKKNKCVDGNVEGEEEH